MPPKKDGAEKHYYGFDSTGLEKAAAVSITFIFIRFRQPNTSIKAKTPRLPSNLQ